MPALFQTTQQPRVSRLDDATVIWLQGEQDVATVRVLADVLYTEIATSNCHVVVDLDQVTFIDGTTVAAIVHGRQMLQDRDRRLTLRAPSPAARRLLDLCGLSDVLDPRRPAPEG
ncbi:MAG: hypothetical protein JWO68_2780 [Actinomycetia bacterium]|nr:hypothetical protein [Actinomycetes bacterium]